MFLKAFNETAEFAFYYVKDHVAPRGLKRYKTLLLVLLNVPQYH